MIKGKSGNNAGDEMTISKIRSEKRTRERPNGKTVDYGKIHTRSISESESSKLTILQWNDMSGENGTRPSWDVSTTIIARNVKERLKLAAREKMKERESRGGIADAGHHEPKLRPKGGGKEKGTGVKSPHVREHEMEVKTGCTRRTEFGMTGTSS